ncbi:hypothetical protein SDC9_165470 [bioreactor metagenome]|uniref:Uncharacterized protein n=1 Tax=bioreactor metagenome TaxID=1076179 RepID=A0A645FWN8_9ZZZZ
MTVDRGHHDGIGACFNRSINIFILAHHHPEVDYVKIMSGKNAIQNFITYCMAVSTDDANNKCRFLHG